MTENMDDRGDPVIRDLWRNCHLNRYLMHHDQLGGLGGTSHAEGIACIEV